MNESGCKRCFVSDTVDHAKNHLQKMKFIDGDLLSDPGATRTHGQRLKRSLLYRRENFPSSHNLFT